MKRFITILLLTVVAFTSFSSPVNAAESPDALIGRAVAKLHKSKSLTADYTISSGGSRSSGQITVEGTKFKITSPQMSTWFDGKTQWTMLVDQKEIDITEPTAGEIQQVNPFAVIDNYKKVYTLRRLKSPTAGKSVVEFTPRKGVNTGGITKAVLTISDSTLNPEKLIVNMSGGNVVTITLSNLRSIAPAGAEAFRPAKSQMRGYEIVDLR